MAWFPTGGSLRSESLLSGAMLSPREPLAAARHWHELSVHHSAKSMDAARHCGAVLVKQKRLSVKTRGGSTFAAWLRGTGISRTQAERYILIAENWDATLPARKSSQPSIEACLRAIKETKHREVIAVRAKTVVGADSILEGDFREVELSDVDLVLSDPPYGSPELYADLARCAASWLRPGGLLAVYAGQYHLPTIMAGMCEHLQYVWTIHAPHVHANQLVAVRRIFCRWKPILLFGRDVKPWWDCAQDSIPSGGRAKDHHEWEQPVSEATHLISHFSPPGGLVVDPMAGSGTVGIAARKLGRRFIGVELDGNAARMARLRVA